MIALPWKFWRPMLNRRGEIDRSAKFIRTAYAWLGLSLVMLLLLPAYHALVKIPFSHAYYGAIRHAFTVGFISLMIMAFAAKVVPTLNGIESRTLTQLWGPYILINTGCFLRVSLQTLTDWNSRAFSFVGISGMLEVTALAWWGTGLVRLMLAGKREQLVVLNEKPPTTVGANHKIDQVVRWFPGTTDVFRSHGLMQNNEPVQRCSAPKRPTIAQAAARTDASLSQLLIDLNNVVENSPGHKERAVCQGCGC